MKLQTLVPVIVSVIALLGIGFAATSGGAPGKGRVFEVYPIGEVRVSGGETFVEVDEKYQDALLGLDEWSHVQVFWWFDKNDTPKKRSILRVHPRGNKKNPLTGVFSCRAPVRPNLIALTTCKILKVEGGRVYLDKIDAFDATPVLDLKPYTPGMDKAANIRIPEWAGGIGKSDAQKGK